MKGKKTYITSVILAILTAIGAYFEWSETTMTSILGVGTAAIGVFLRSGVQDLTTFNKGSMEALSKLSDNAQAQVNHVIEQTKLKSDPDSYSMGLDEAIALLERMDKLNGKTMTRELTEARSNAAAIVERFTKSPPHLERRKAGSFPIPAVDRQEFLKD